MTKMLIDTGAWIDFLRNSSGDFGDRVALAIEQETAVICGVVISELLQGAKGVKENKQLEFLFDTVAKASVDENDWHEAGVLLQKLRQKGITLPLTDALIAVVAQRNQLSVLTKDKHFQHLPVRTVS